MKYKPFNPYKDGKYPFASVTLTIGCNVDGKPEHKPETVWYTAHKHIHQNLHSYKVTEGTWEGIPETSVHIYVFSIVYYQMDSFLQQVEALADALNQDAIGVWDNYGGSTLVYGSRWYEKQNQAKNA